MLSDSRPRSLRNTPALVAALAALAVAGTAEAGKGAPIVYMDQGTSGQQRISSERQTVFISPDQARLSDEKARARIQFQYPGQQPATRPAGQAAAQTASAASEPRRAYASIEAPLSSIPAPSAEYAAGPDGFDAAAAATRLEQQKPAREVETAALPALDLPARAEQGAAARASGGLTPAASHTVTPEPVPVFDESGVAVVFGDEFEGLPTANGEMFRQTELFAAHPSLPLPSLVEVVNTATNAQIVVRVNDRGPFEEGATLQVSKRAAAELGMSGAGRANVRIRYLGPAPVTSARAAREPAPAYTSASSAIPTYTPVANTPRPATTQYRPEATGDYFVQVGAFSDISNAQSLEQTLPAAMQTVVTPARVNGADYFRVRVGPFISRDAAEQVQADLRGRGFTGGRVVTGN